MVTFHLFWVASAIIPPVVISDNLQDFAILGNGSQDMLSNFGVFSYMVKLFGDLSGPHRPLLHEGLRAIAHLPFVRRPCREERDHQPDGGDDGRP